MESLIFSLESTVPIFLVMVLGFCLMRKGFLTEEFVRIADKYVFKVALPALLFKQIATADIYEEFDITFVIFCMASTTVIFGGIWMLAKLLLKDKSLVGAFTQASARGSAAILGIAFIENIYGSSGMGPLMIISAVPLYNIYSVIILTMEAGGSKKNGTMIKKTVKAVLKNPIIIGIFLGLPFAFLRIDIPVIPMKGITMVSQTATPLALLVVGAGFDGRKALTRIRETVAATVIKLIGIPALFLPIALSIGFRNEALVAIIIMLASPTTVTTVIMAKNMDNDEALSASIVVLATLLSAFSLTFWVFLLRYNIWI